MSVNVGRLSPTEKRAMLIEMLKRRGARRGAGTTRHRKSGLITSGATSTGTTPCGGCGDGRTLVGGGRLKT
jgi:hypothetical protein